MDTKNLCVSRVGSDKIIDILPEHVYPLILELSGGGYTEASTSKAMENGEKLRTVGYVTIGDSLIFRKGSEADPMQHSRDCDELPKITDSDDDAVPGQQYLIA